jgi:hypothetical protein
MAVVRLEIQLIGNGEENHRATDEARWNQPQRGEQLFTPPVREPLTTSTVRGWLVPFQPRASCHWHPEYLTSLCRPDFPARRAKCNGPASSGQALRLGARLPPESWLPGCPCLKNGHLVKDHHRAKGWAFPHQSPAFGRKLNFGLIFRAPTSRRPSGLPKPSPRRNQR